MRASICVPSVTAVHTAWVAAARPAIEICRPPSSTIVVSLRDYVPCSVVSSSTVNLPRHLIASRKNGTIGTINLNRKNGSTIKICPSGRSWSLGRSSVVTMAGPSWLSSLLSSGGKPSAASGSPANGMSGSGSGSEVNRALQPDDSVPAAGCELISLGAGCFWGVELALQRVPGVTKTSVGYQQGHVDNPSYRDVCSGSTGHAEVVLVEYDPKQTALENILDVFWKRHDPTQVDKQGNDVGSQYRSGIYFYTPEQEAIAKQSLERVQAQYSKKIATELLPANKFYAAEEYHQQYLAKGGRMGLKQSAAKGCNDPIRCYG